MEISYCEQKKGKYQHQVVYHSYCLCFLKNQRGKNTRLVRKANTSVEGVRGHLHERKGKNVKEKKVDKIFMKLKNCI